MFDFVAKHKRILQLVIALTAVPFLFFGLESYTRMAGGAGDVANVDGAPITQREFDEELRRQQDRVRELFGRNADLAELDTPEMRLAILEGMIANRLVTAEALQSRIMLSKEEVVAGLMAAPDFQENGKFSPERYSAYLRARGLSDQAYVAQLRIEIPASRLAAAVSGTAFQPRTVAQRLVALNTQKREIAEAFLPSEQYLARDRPDESRLKNYYDTNATEFKLPERIRAEYIVVSANALGKSEQAAEAELKAAYEARAGQLGAAEQRRASHILVNTKEEADKLAAELKKSPERFAAVAKQHSQDPGSADKGGDLGLNARGSLASKTLESAIFALAKDAIGGPVQTEFGFHLLRVTAIQPGKLRSFEELKPELAAEIARQKGAKKFAEVAEGVNNMVYEQSDSLKPVAERYKLEVLKSPWFAKQSAPEDLGALSHPKLIAALFSPDAIQQRRNTDAVEVAPGVLVAARVTEHQPAAQRPFAEVKADIERKLARREAAALALKEGTAKLDALAKGEDAGLRWSAAKTVSRREPQGLTPAALRLVMTANAAKLPAYAGLARGDDGYVIYRISKLIDTEAGAEVKNSDELARIDLQTGAEQLDAYVAALRARAKIEINRANLQKQ